MKLKNYLIVVNDIEESKKFYEELFGLKDIEVESILSQYLEPNLYDLAMEE